MSPGSSNSRPRTPTGGRRRSRAQGRPARRSARSSCLRRLSFCGRRGRRVEHARSGARARRVRRRRRPRAGDVARAGSWWRQKPLRPALPWQRSPSPRTPLHFGDGQLTAGSVTRQLRPKPTAGSCQTVAKRAVSARSTLALETRKAPFPGLSSRVANGTRTRDHRDHNPGLYQLSYRHRALDRIARSRGAYWRGDGPVAQWIERQASNLRAEVQFLPGPLRLPRRAQCCVRRSRRALRGSVRSAPR